jgi:hypothetical protein
MLNVAKAALTNAGGTLVGVFEDIQRDALWLKAEIPSCSNVAEGACIPVVLAIIDEACGSPMLRISGEANSKLSFRLVTEVKR